MEQEDLVHSPGLALALDRIGLEFLADFLEVEVARHAENLGAWTDLGHLCTRLGRHERALEVDRELARRLPDDETVHYNLACSLALLGRVDEALSALGRAVELGYADADHLEADEDLGALRGDERFTALVQKLRAGA